MFKCIYCHKILASQERDKLTCNENLTYISDEMLQALTNNVELYKNNAFSNIMNIKLTHNQMICKMVKPNQKRLN